MVKDVRVLYVDGDAEWRVATADRIEARTDRIEVVPVAGAEAARAVLDDEAVDCVVSEFPLADAEGRELPTRVRERHPDLPVVVYTGRDPDDIAGDAVPDDAAFVTKPAAPSDDRRLASRIVALVEESRASRQVRKYERIVDLIRAVQSELVRATTAEDVARAACETLAETEPYAFVWIGEYEAAEGRVVPRASAGIEDAYLDAVEVTADDSLAGQGPTGEAIRSRSLQVVQDIPTDERYGPWRADAMERGYRSSAAVPLVHEDALYGVLNVYADRTGAFDDDERALLSDLGAAIARAHHRVRMQAQFEAQYRELFEEAPVMMALTRDDGGDPVIEDCNRRFAETLGYEREQLREERLATVYTDESARRLLNDGYERALAGEFVTNERTFVTRTGGEVETLLQATPRRDAEGDVVGTHALYVNVTDRRRAREVLGQAEAMEASMDGMAILDENEGYVYVNRAHAEIYGYDDADAQVGVDWRDCYTAETVERFEREIRPRLADGDEWRGEVTGVRADGVTFPQELSLTRLDNGRILGVVRDISARKERERRLERSRERLRVLFEESPDAIFVHDETGTVLDVNDQSVESLGYSRSELLSMTLTDFEVGHDDDALRDTWASMAVGETAKWEGTHERRDGSTFPVAVWATKIEIGDDERYLSLARDWTERVRYERRLETQRDNLEILNQVVRHDIRNDLQLVLAYAQALESSVDVAGREHVEKVLSAARDAVDITKTAREVADVMLQADAEPSPVDLRRVLEEELDEIRASAEETVVTTEETLPDVEVLADEMLGSVFRNLLTNAVTHNDKEVKNVVVSATQGDDTVTVRIADNGPGIADERKEAVFEDGERGLDSEGTGLGLYLVRTLVERYGGDVWIEDNDPIGTVVTVELPVAESVTH